MKRLLMASALVALCVVVPVATGATGGSDRPFKATFTGLVTHGPGRCDIVTTNITATGEVSHLGRAEASWSHCPLQPAGDDDGQMTIVAANGDTLYGEYDWSPAYNVGNDTPPITFAGGSGRFEDATGSIVGTFELIPQFVAGCNPVPDPVPCYDFSVPWPWSATFVGAISY